MRKVIFVLSCLGYSTMSLAQSNYQKSKIVTPDKDTLSGWIDYKEWDKNPVSFKFSDNAEGRNARVYTPEQVSYFEIEGQDYFERFLTDMSMDQVARLEDLHIGPDTASVHGLAWLRIVRKGTRLNLYSYQDKVKTRYYIRVNDRKEVSELKYQRYLDPGFESGGAVIVDRAYRYQLMKVAERFKNVNTAECAGLLQKTDYTLPGIAKVVDMINGPSAKSFVPKGRAKVQFYAGLALLSSRVSYTGDNVLAKGATSKASYLPKINAGIDLFVNPHVRKMILRFDLSLALAKNKITKPMGMEDGFVRHTFDQFTVAFSPQIIYNIYNSSKARISLGTGINANYSIYSNNLYEQKYTIPGPGGHYDYEEELKMEPFWFNIPLRAGIILKDRFDFYAQYNVIPSPVASFASYTAKVSTWQAGVNILLQ